MDEVFVVYANAEEIRIAFHVFATRELAEKWVARATRSEWDDHGNEQASAAELIDVTFTIERLKVRDEL